MKSKKEVEEQAPIENKERKTAKEVNMPIQALYGRINIHGWDIIKAIETPLKKDKRKRKNFLFYLLCTLFVI